MIEGNQYVFFSYKGFLFKELSFELLFIPSPTKLRRDIHVVTLPSVRHILVNTLESTWKSIRFQILLRTKYVPSLVNIHWRMLILECSQRCYAVKIWPCDLDIWPWKSIGFQILLRTKHVPSLVKIHWRMLILECSQGCDGRTVALLHVVKVTGSNFYCVTSLWTL
jgi:hypothetical protein